MIWMRGENGCRMARSVLMVEVSWGRVWGRPRLRWNNGVKVPMGRRGTTVETEIPREDIKEWRAHVHM